MRKFLTDLIKSNSGLSSNRFLGVFIFSPVLVFLLFFKYDMEYIYAVIGLITALLITNAAAKFSKNNRKDDYHDTI